MSNNYLQDIPYTKQSDIQEYINAFDVENESINFTTLENYSNSDYVFNANALQKVKNNIDVMQSNFDNDIISGLDDKRELFQSWVNNLFANARSWQPGAENKYYKNDVVTYSEDPGAYFICLEDCDGTEPINYVKFTNTFNNIDKFDWGVCVNGDIDDENTLFIGHPEIGTLNMLRLRYRYDGDYTLRFVKKDDFVGEIDYLIFKGSKEIFEHMNYVVDDSSWLRIYPKGKTGLDAFEFNWRGEWQSGEPYTIGMALPPEVIYQSIVWYQVGRDINFYACIQNVTSNIPPDQDTTHWVKLFTKKLDGFVVLDSMPNQAWFDDDTNPSVFGVKQSDGITIRIIDRVHSESASNPQYLKLYTVANNVVDSNDNNLNTLIRNLISNTNI